MNLITDAWIPITGRDGKRRRIRPAGVTGDVRRLDAPRPDFNGALIQFLIGLIQTVLTPEKGEWEARYQKPPSAKELDALLEPFAKYFQLDGKSPRFMQDFNLEDGSEVEIAGLLIEAPGAKTIKDNTDHFIKRDTVDRMCPACAATALFTLQTNAPSGGVGHRTSLRGGGPPSTLLIPDGADEKTNTLWHRIWLNVLDKDVLKRTNCATKLKKHTAWFPWSAPTRTSDKEGGAVTSDDMHPNQIYWSMPRRIVLDDPVEAEGACDVCGESGPRFYTGYRTRNYGIEYGDGILHPLSPYYRDKETLRPRHPQPGGFTYRHWPDFVVQKENAGERALVMRRIESDYVPYSVLAFGYDMDNMKARCWYQTEMPLFKVPEKSRDAFAALARDMAEAARQIAGNTRNAVRLALFDPKRKVRGDLSFVDLEFWNDTEGDYYGTLKTVAGREITVPAEAGDETRNFLKALHRSSLVLFDHYVNDGGYQYGDPENIARARGNLRRFNHAKKIYGLLYLPEPEKKHA